MTLYPCKVHGYFVDSSWQEAEFRDESGRADRFSCGCHYPFGSRAIWIIYDATWCHQTYSLNKDYTELCSQNVPVTSLLFGDDLQQQLNTIKVSNKITQASASGTKSQSSTYKSSSSDNWKRKPSDQYYRHAYPLRNHWKNRGEKLKKPEVPLLQEKGGGQELNTNNNGLIILDWLQVSNFEANVDNLNLYLSQQVQSFQAGKIRTCFSMWQELTLDPEILNAAGQGT